MKLYINPHPSEFKEDGIGSGGIWRVINAQAKWLPEYGVEIVDNQAKADLVCIHAGALVQTNRPIVTHNHGLYWTGDFEWARDYWEYNALVAEALREAHTITVPSEWVAYPIRRDMRKPVYVIPHGIDLDEWIPQPHRDYVLWGKPRVDTVSDPRPVNELAQLAPNIQFVTTFGQPMSNVAVLGAMPFTEFKRVLAEASIWLATARETGDIASREAMALGIPVLSWRWGATAELVKHKLTGYLAEPNDYDDLREGLEFCLAHRDELGQAAREDVKRFQWHDIMGQYVQVYRETLEEATYEYDVSIIVPAYNYAHYLPECLDSIKAQKFGGKLQVVVVDDCSTDDTLAVLSRYPEFEAVRHSQNAGLVAALNTGHGIAKGKYLMNLDADNKLCPGAVQRLFNYAESKPWVDVVTGDYRILGTNRVHGGEVSAKAQLDHYNQIPSTCLIRTRAIRGLGGYRPRQHKNEDAEFWCRALSAGVRAEYTPGDLVFEYRWHDDNKSAREGGEDDPEGPLSWNFFFPWRVFPDITPFACTAPAPNACWPVWSYERPHIAVVIPCGPGHERFLPDALDSVYAQTYRQFECIVANDTGKPLDVASMGHPWVRVVNTEGRKGPAIARNTAISVARAPLIVPLDADDFLYPDTLRLYYEAWVQHPDTLVYGDCIGEDDSAHPEKLVPYFSGPFTDEKIRQEAIYQDVILFAKNWWQAVGGYPTDQFDQMWEDWLFGLKLHFAGIGATYAKSPWGVYRKWTGGEYGPSKNQLDNADWGGVQFKERYQKLLDWLKQKEEDMCRGCGKQNPKPAAYTYDPMYRSEALPAGEQMKVICIAPQQGERSMNSRIQTGYKYVFAQGTILTLLRGDEWIANHKDFRRYVEPQEAAPIALPAQPPTPPPIPLPISKQPVPVISIVPEQPPVQEKPQQAEVSVSELGLSEALTAKLIEAGFTAREKLREDIFRTGGTGIRAIKGIGPKALVDIKKAVLG